jgi:hypothetical protein
MGQYGGVGKKCLSKPFVREKLSKVETQRRFPPSLSLSPSRNTLSTVFRNISKDRVDLLTA